MKPFTKFSKRSLIPKTCEALARSMGRLLGRGLTTTAGLAWDDQQRVAAAARSCRWPEGASSGLLERWRVASRQASFTLLEVLVACAIFFMAVFAVLGILTQGLGAARSLQLREPDAGLLAAAMSLTNRIEEGSEAGDFEDIAPGLYPGYSWTRDVYEVGSNGLFQVDFTVIRRAGKGRGPSQTQMSILLFRPGSPIGSRFRSGG